MEQEPGPKMEVTRRQERIAFLLVTAVVFPLLAVLVVAGYGFMVWMWQLLFAGPPKGP
ncbi:periplasmic nitrate reductase, NapE protein [Pseudoxanthomonas sp. SGT-18]|uniref:periplasmic nitrate reductase, NapE protein n=1 Tax=Pseudoxanthomonas sp. SGT-18 TaxID=2493087 RepID=UPI0031B87434